MFALLEGGNTIALVAENDQEEVRRPGRIRHRVLIGLAVCAVVLIIFHRPILLAIGRQIGTAIRCTRKPKDRFSPGRQSF